MINIFLSNNDIFMVYAAFLLYVVLDNMLLPYHAWNAGRCGIVCSDAYVCDM